MKKTFKLKDIDPVVFSGAGDENIKLIENFFNSKIVLRGNNLIVDGLKKEISEIELLIENIMYTINNKGFIGTSDINVLINSSSAQNISTNSDSKLDNVILYTYKGAVVAETKGQKKYYKAVCNNDIVFAIGPAGTGKTYQAVACAVSALKNNEVEKIVITRPVVEAGERLGFLPGDLKDKVDPYLVPIYDSLHKMIESQKLKEYLNKNIIEIAPLAYMRGRTLHNAFIILDEAQNSTKMQMKMFLTRLGVTSKAIITGDLTQTDLGLNETSGLTDAANILNRVKGISFVTLDESDIVRHKLVKDIIKAYKKGDK
ncbi:MAG: phosphate starvation-inducible protein PhoH [Cytophagia bacterium]|nr:phosphate starvation-inducible protein PhoH [Cytophagia bacterium]|tara:strand:- start:900 stop:1844 length:945 start_codon:yes stop_codon:yes gene_type:complete